MNPSITDVIGVKVGTAQDLEALTGCTVVLTEAGATCGVDVRGGGPGTRETDLLDPVNTIDKVHAILLTGGSSFGLAAADGVMQFLEEHGVGFNTGRTVVPIVPGAVLFDLNVGDFKVRPDRNMGYEAARNAGLNVLEGNFGAGTGATVGKIKGNQYCTKSGQGSYSMRLPNGLVVGALVAVNAFGDVMLPGTNTILAGAQDPHGRGFQSTVELLIEGIGVRDSAFLSNTTLAVVASNAKLTKAGAKKVAMMSHNGLARSINPVHTLWDGDTVFALATGEIEVEPSMVGILAQEVLAQAVVRAVKAATSVQGLRCSQDILSTG